VRGGAGVRVRVGGLGSGSGSSSGSGSGSGSSLELGFGIGLTFHKQAAGHVEGHPAICREGSISLGLRVKG
jgi:hypothetical protein